MQRAEDEGDARRRALTDQRLREAARRDARQRLLRPARPTPMRSLRLLRSHARLRAGTRHAPFPRSVARRRRHDGRRARRNANRRRQVLDGAAARGCRRAHGPPGAYRDRQRLSRATRRRAAWRPSTMRLVSPSDLSSTGSRPQDRQRAYACDVTYCTNKELVFDYLRDRLALGDRRARARLLLDEIVQDQVSRAVSAPALARSAFRYRR